MALYNALYDGTPSIAPNILYVKSLDIEQNLLKYFDVNGSVQTTYPMALNLKFSTLTN